MKRLLTVFGFIFSICACLCFAACGGCNGLSGCGGTSAPAVLAVPEISIDYDGVASWQAVENASGYMYRIDGEDTPTEQTFAQLSDGQSIRVKAVGDGVKYIDSGWSKAETFTQTFALSVPDVAIDEDGTASWSAIENAVGYTVKTGETETEINELFVKLSNGQSIQVKAVSGGGIYRDSEFSAVKYYNKLSAPRISVNDDGLASWEEVAGAIGYKYKINGETAEHDAEEFSVQLSNGFKISVKAVGGDGWFDSDWATATYIDVTKMIKLATPEVTIDEVISGVTGIALWSPVEHASGYAYKISGGEEQTVTLSVLSCALKANDTISVKALGDGIFYADSEWSEEKAYEVEGNAPVTLSAPVVSIDGEGVARWSAVDGADWYEVEIDGKYDSVTTELYKQLNDGQFIRVRAVDENGNESAFSKPIKYEAPVSDEVTVNGVKFDFSCIDEASSAVYDVKSANADFKTASGNSNGFQEVIGTDYVYKGNSNDGETGLLKFGTGSSDGYLTFNFKKEVLRVVIVCRKYGSDLCKLTVNGGTAKAPATALGELTFDLATPALKIKIEAEKRCLVYGIIVYFRLPASLDKPEVNIDENGVATWQAVENASGYFYSVNGGEAQVATELKVQLETGDRIVVWAVGDEIDYTAGVSDEKTYLG